MTAIGLGVPVFIETVESNVVTGPGPTPTPALVEVVVAGPQGPPGADSTVPGPQGPPGADSTVSGPQGPPGADSTVPGPQGPPGADSTVPGPQGLPGGGLMVRKTTDESVVSTTTMQDDNELALPVSAGQTINFDFLLFVTGNNTGGFMPQITAPAGATLLVADQGNRATGDSLMAQNFATGGTIGGLGMNGTTTVVRVFGVVIAGSTAGVIQLRWAQAVSNATPTVVKAGSYGVASLTPATVTSNGPLVGTGFPEAVVTASVGTEYIDTAATNGAVKWIKATGTGNTGWKCIVGDTGWRKVVDVFASGATALTLTTTVGLGLRRVNGQVFTRLIGGERLTLSGTGDRVNVPLGFRAADNQVWHWNKYDATTSFYIYAESSGSIFRAASGPPNPFASGIFPVTADSWATDSTWPTTLPGTAA